MPVRPEDRTDYESHYTAAVAELSQLPEEEPFSAADQALLSPDPEWNRRQWLIHLIASKRAELQIGLIDAPESPIPE